jgi:type IV pilus assembly protein PilW
MIFESRNSLSHARRSNGALLGTAVHGFSLIELMVAMVLGILVSIGLVTLFGATSKTNRVQNAMARLQENGRYVVTRLNDDVRMATSQSMNASGAYTSTVSADNGPVNLSLAVHIYAASIPFPDGAVAEPTGWLNDNWWPLSVTNSLKGYECTSGTCSPTVPSLLPATGTTANKRAQGSDVLLMRYLAAPGWSSSHGSTSGPEVQTACNGGKLDSLTVSVTTGGTYSPPSLNFQTGDLALLSTTGFLEVFQVAASGDATSVTLTPQNVLNSGKPACSGSSSRETRVFNFTRDFITVIYWVRLDADPNDGSRVIPVLIRTQIDNSGAAAVDQELVRGVERMDFLYGTQLGLSDADSGSVRYFTANQMAAASTSTNCAPPPIEFQSTDNIPAANEYEAGCLWRSVKNIEAHFLLDSVDNMYDLSQADMGFQYNGSGLGVPPATGNMPVTGLAPGKMLRREFVALVSIRNFNP